MLVAVQHVVDAPHIHVCRMHNWNARLHEGYMCGIKYGDSCCDNGLSHSVFDGVDVGCDADIRVRTSRCSSFSNVVASIDVWF